MNENFKCGTVALIGEPNAGKSTLLNALVGCQVAITAPMAGTTRNAIKGILNTENAQIIFVDTPGMQKATNLLERKMNREISGAVKSADVICYVLDSSHVTERAIAKLSNYQDFGVPVILALTKIDAVSQDKVFSALNQIKDLSFIKGFIPVSAKKKIALKGLILTLTNYLPKGQPIFESEIYTDSSTKEMVAEIIRESVINQVHDEIPAGVKIVITKYETLNREVKIDADIVCDKPNHKKIIIGTKGNMIRKIGISARKKIEDLLGKHVILNTFVVVKEGWRDQAQAI